MKRVRLLADLTQHHSRLGIGALGYSGESGGPTLDRFTTVQFDCGECCTIFWRDLEIVEGCPTCGSTTIVDGDCPHCNPPDGRVE